MSIVMRSYARVIAFIVLAAACLTQAGCPADDWGYEIPEQEQSHPVVETVLPRQSRLETRKQQAVEDWLQLYTFMAANQLTDSQKVQLRKLLDQPVLAQEDLLFGVLLFWPKVRLETTRNLDEVEGYRSLFRALLRMQLQYKPKSIVGGQDAASEVLGPARIAVTGDPPLTEAAVNSYCDMACFLFEQKNPGRTMDVAENRAFFAKVIEDKFKNAPDAIAREAMSNFDLNWAKFKIMWATATPAQRTELLKLWTEPGSNASETDSLPLNPTLSEVLKEGPWREMKGKMAG